MKTILLATTGMSPAVLTETVWALAREKPAVIPDEVYVITTVSGAGKLKEQLFGPDAVWETLRKNILGKKSGCDNRLVFDPSDIVVARKKLGGKKIALDALADIADHTAFADTIMDELWKYTSKPDTRVVASLAGGYKTMSALMLSSMQLLANSGDRITHILVSGGLDALNSGFFYPQNEEQARHIHLIDIPIIPLRRWFSALNRKPTSYEALVYTSLEALERRTEEIRIELPHPDAHPYWIKVNGTENKLTPNQYSYLRFFAENAKNKEKPFASLKDIEDPFKAWVGKTIDGIETANLDADKINRRLSELRRAIPDLAPSLPARGKWMLAILPEHITLH